jgi:hypothetical protein
MKSRNTAEEELDKIRIKLYEETKGMTIDESVVYLKSLAAPILKEFSIRTLNQIKEDEQAKKEAIA